MTPRVATAGGTSVQAERAGYHVNRVRPGFGARFAGHGKDWFHFAVPTPVTFGGKNSELQEALVPTGQPRELGSYASGRPFDDSRTLRVPLPREVVWPPKASSRILLDLYDPNAIEREAGGGQVIALRFGGGVSVLARTGCG